MPKVDEEDLLYVPLQLCSVKVLVSVCGGREGRCRGSSGWEGEGMMAPRRMGPSGGLGRGGVRKYVGLGVGMFCAMVRERECCCDVVTIGGCGDAVAD